MRRIDKLLNGLTMYQLVLYGLMLIVAFGFITSAVGILGHPVKALAGSLILLSTVGYICHWILIRIFNSAPSFESWIITVLILFLILKPAQTIADYAVLGLGITIAMTSKYIFTSARRHIFNPIAIALVIIGLLGSGEIYWWVGNQAMFPIVLAVGLLVVRKIRRFDMVIPFVLVAMTTYVVSRGISQESLASLRTIILSGPLLFFATFMLTEPQTSPHTRRSRTVFAVIVGLLFGLPFAYPPLFSSPELALLAGNIFAFVISSKQRMNLEFNKMTVQGSGIYEFSFLADRPLAYKPGQYMEWTLPHAHTDKRGDRRYFTIASSPSEPDIKLVVRIDSKHSSSFKRALLLMKPGDEISVAQLSGDFGLPRNKNQKIVMMAGGIGITPFRSMVKNMIDQKSDRDVVLYYSAHDADGFSYHKIFDKAAERGVHAYYHVTGKDVPVGWTGRRDIVTPYTIRHDIANYRERLFYLSGPNAMVISYKKMLLEAGVSRKHIYTDYFPGF